MTEILTDAANDRNFGRSANENEVFSRRPDK